jgi:tetratricopeptide (TPR) repeat protein
LSRFRLWLLLVACVAVEQVVLIPPGLAQPQPAATPPGNPPAPPGWSASPAEREQADGHLQRGLDYYAEGDFELAIIQFRAGFKLDPRPEFLFALAQAERRSGDCASAIIYYRRFLATGPTPEQTAAATAQRDHCEEALGSEPIVDDGANREGEASSLAGASSSGESDGSEPRQPRWYHDVATDVLLGGGAALGIAGVGFLFSASSAADDARDAESYQAYADAVDRNESRTVIGAVALGAGVALLGYAGWRILRSGGDSGESQERSSFGLSAQPDGISLTLGGRF